MAPSPDPMAALDSLIAAAGSGDLGRIARRHDLRLLGVFGSAFRRWHDPRLPEPHDLDVGLVAAAVDDVLDGFAEYLTQFAAFLRSRGTGERPTDAGG